MEDWKKYFLYKPKPPSWHEVAEWAKYLCHEEKLILKYEVEQGPNSVTVKIYHAEDFLAISEDWKPYVNAKHMVDDRTQIVPLWSMMGEMITVRGATEKRRILTLEIPYVHY